MKTSHFVLCGALSLGTFACGDDGKSEDTAGGAHADIVDTAVRAGSFNTLVTAVKAADLETTLRGPGPFTLFAPTDAAFQKLPAGTVDALLKPESKAMLVDVLTYHVVPGKLGSADVAKATSLTTVEGKPLTVTLSGAEVRIDDAKVTTADVAANNGVIHAIDSVVVPD
jgi:uncharacterized surface protein with fasciclin (FAS1) repeats